MIFTVHVKKMVLNRELLTKTAEYHHEESMGDNEVAQGYGSNGNEE